MLPSCEPSWTTLSLNPGRLLKTTSDQIPLKTNYIRIGSDSDEANFTGLIVGGSAFGGVIVILVVLLIISNLNKKRNKPVAQIINNIVEESDIDVSSYYEKSNRHHERIRDKRIKEQDNKVFSEEYKPLINKNNVYNSNINKVNNTNQNINYNENQQQNYVNSVNSPQKPISNVDNQHTIAQNSNQYTNVNSGNITSENNTTSDIQSILDKYKKKPDDNS